MITKPVIIALMIVLFHKIVQMQLTYYFLVVNIIQYLTIVTLEIEDETIGINLKKKFTS
jgi:hypothetical protein